MSDQTAPGDRPDRNRAAAPARGPRRYRDRSLPGDTRVDLPTGLAILLGMAVLSGSVVALVMAGFAVFFGWLVSGPPPGRTRNGRTRWP